MHAKSIFSAFIFACTNRDLSLHFFPARFELDYLKLLFETTGQGRSSLAMGESEIQPEKRCFPFSHMFLLIT